MLIALSAVSYLLIALYFFRIWLAVFQRDTSVSPGEKPGAMAILVGISIFWPIVVPLAYLELLNTKQRTKTSCSSCQSEESTCMQYPASQDSNFVKGI